jgi:hypothetical protein
LVNAADLPQWFDRQRGRQKDGSGGTLATADEI